MTGTGTDVGKTWVAASLARRLREDGRRVSLRKPAQSFLPGTVETDAHALARESGEEPHDVCPPHRWYAAALAPVMAAAACGAPSFTIDELVSELSWPADAAIGLVEGAGGLRSPLAADGDNRVYAGALAPDVVVVVADAGLGTINAVRMTVDALDGLAAVVHLNRFDSDDDVHGRNRTWLADRDGFDVVTSIADLADRVAPRRAPSG